MAGDAERGLFDRERRYYPDLTIRAFNELGDEMEYRHTAPFPDFGPPEDGERYLSRSRSRSRLR